MMLTSKIQRVGCVKLQSDLFLTLYTAAWPSNIITINEATEAVSSHAHRCHIDNLSQCHHH